MYSDNCPKSIDDLLVYPSCTAFFSRETALRDLPHSRQTRLARGVISPQDGHILCGRGSWTSGFTIASSLPRNSRAEASRRRRVGRYGSINFTFAGIPLIGPISDNLTMTGHHPQFCAGLLTLPWFFQPAAGERSSCTA